MKKILLLSLLFFVLHGVSDAKIKGYYMMALIEVDAGEIKGEVSTNNNEKNVSFSTYKDSLINIVFYIHPTHVSFVLENRSQSKMKLIWDEAIFSGFNGSSIGVFHDGVKYNDRETEQVATTILKGSKVSDIIIPKTHVEWNRSLGRWLHYYILSGEGGSDDKTIDIMLPIQVDGKQVDYVFSFRSTWSKPKFKTRMSSGLEYYMEIKQ